MVFDEEMAGWRGAGAVKALADDMVQIPAGCTMELFSFIF
jgi:hypothetical protein